MKGEVNVYVCPKCKGHTVTVDLDDGVTPFMLGCRANGTTSGCGGMAESSFYRPNFNHGPPAWEWYKPDQLELSNMRDANMLRHVAMGGLCLRKIGNTINVEDRR